MPLIDDRGRVFGRVNLIDALVVFVLLGLIPLAYGAFLLFRVPRPRITSVTPAQLVEFQPGSVQIAGEDFRPFLLAKVGAVASDFLVLTPKQAEIRVPATLSAGTYDITLADQGQVLMVKPGALTVVPASAVRLDVQALGSFVGLNAEDARLIKVQSTFQSAAAAALIAEVVAIRPPEPGTSRVKLGTNVFAKGTLADLRVPAIVRLHCTVINAECRVADTVAAANATVTLPLVSGVSTGQSTAATTTQVKFAIDQIFPPGMRAEFPAIATLRVHFVAEPEIFNVIKAGDIDVSGLVDGGGGAVLQEVSEKHTTTVLTNPEPLLRRGVQVQQPMMTFNGTLRLPLVLTPLGWRYHDQLVKVGAVFNFETASGAMTGWILDVKLDQTPHTTQAPVQ